MKNVYLAIINSTDERKVLSVSESRETAINSIKYQREKELTEGYLSKYLTEYTNINNILNEGCFNIAIIDFYDTNKDFFAYDNGDHYLELFIKEMELQK